ncbi:MAG: pyridoxamine 5'-phosphate oxidase family protein [Tepidiformaceae bacterium]
MTEREPVEPRVERPHVPSDYGMPDNDEGMLPWSWALERLETALSYWVISVWPGNRPHASPVWGVWMDGVFYFDGSSETRRMKNILANPETVVHLESADEVVILEGRANPVPPPPDRALAARLAARYTEKYAAHDYKPAPDTWDAGGLYELRPRQALGWMLKPGIEFGTTYTRWRF